MKRARVLDVLITGPFYGYRLLILSCGHWKKSKAQEPPKVGASVVCNKPHPTSEDGQ